MSASPGDVTASRRPIPPGSTLDGITFSVIVHRIQNPADARGGPWLIRIYAADEHVHSAEGGVSLDVGLRAAQDAMREWIQANGGGPR